MNGFVTVETGGVSGMCSRKRASGVFWAVGDSEMRWPLGVGWAEVCCPRLFGTGEFGGCVAADDGDVCERVPPGLVECGADMMVERFARCIHGSSDGKFRVSSALSVLILSVSVCCSTSVVSRSCILRSRVAVRGVLVCGVEDVPRLRCCLIGVGCAAFERVRGVTGVGGTGCGRLVCCCTPFRVPGDAGVCGVRVWIWVSICCGDGGVVWLPEK